jgi:hypothetical protein
MSPQKKNILMNLNKGVYREQTTNNKKGGTMKLAAMLWFVLACSLYSTAQAVAFEWAAYSDPVAESFSIWRAMPDGTRTLMLEGIDIDATAAEVAVPNECGTYFITALGDGRESEASNTASWCPDPAVPPADDVRPTQIIQFSITGEVMIQ